MGRRRKNKKKLRRLVAAYLHQDRAEKQSQEKPRVRNAPHLNYPAGVRVRVSGDSEWGVRSADVLAYDYSE